MPRFCSTCSAPEHGEYYARERYRTRIPHARAFAALRYSPYLDPSCNTYIEIYFIVVRGIRLVNYKVSVKGVDFGVKRLAIIGFVKNYTLLFITIIY